MNFSEQNSQQLGELRADVENLERVVSRMEIDVREVRDIMLKAQGGWKTLITLGTICAVLGGFVTKLIGWLIPLLNK